MDGTYAYLVVLRDLQSRWSLEVIDLKNPVTQHRLGASSGAPTWNSSCDGLTLQGSLACLADGRAGFRFIDISNPGAPKELSRFDSQYARDVALQGPYACVIEQAAGPYGSEAASALWLIDTRNPAALRAAGQCVVGDWAHDAAVHGRYAFVAGGYAGLRVVDIRNPANPISVGGWRGADGASFLVGGIAVRGSYACVLDHYASGLRLFDVINPADPRQIGGCYFRDGESALAIQGQYAYVTGFGLTIIDLSTPADPRLLGEYNHGQYSSGVAVRGPYAYLSEWNGWVHVIGVRDPAKPRRVARLQTGGRPSDLSLVNNELWVADVEGGLSILGIPQ